MCKQKFSAGFYVPYACAVELFVYITFRFLITVTHLHQACMHKSYKIIHTSGHEKIIIYVSQIPCILFWKSAKRVNHLISKIKAAKALCHSKSCNHMFMPKPINFVRSLFSVDGHSGKYIF